MICLFVRVDVSLKWRLSCFGMKLFVSLLKIDGCFFVRGQLQCGTTPRCGVWEEETEAAAWAPYGLQALHGSGDCPGLYSCVWLWQTSLKVSVGFVLDLFICYSSLTLGYIVLYHRYHFSRAVCWEFASPLLKHRQKLWSRAGSTEVSISVRIHCIWLTVLNPFQRTHLMIHIVLRYPQPCVQSGYHMTKLCLPGIWLANRCQWWKRSCMMYLIWKSSINSTPCFRFVVNHTFLWKRIYNINTLQLTWYTECVQVEYHKLKCKFSH